MIVKKSIFILFCGLLCTTTLLAQKQGVSGSIRWKISDGTLNITGIGNMPNYSMGAAPWYSIRETITKLVIGKTVTSIGKLAFYEFTNLTDVSISDQVAFIGDRAFEDCTALETVVIPAKVTTIGDRAFSGCNLRMVTVKGTKPAALAGNNIFPKKSIILIVPEGAEQTYSTAWKVYFDRVSSSLAALEETKRKDEKLEDVSGQENSTATPNSEKDNEVSSKNSAQKNMVESEKDEINEIDYFKENLFIAYENAFLFQNVSPDWAKLGLRGKVKSVQETDKNNQTFTVFFNDVGRITKMEMPSRGTKTFSYSSRRLSGIKEQKADGKVQETVVRYNNNVQINIEEPAFQYASNGMAVKVGYSTSGPVVWRWRTLEFDENTGFIIKEIPEDSHGIETLYEYNEKGRCVKKTFWVWENEHDNIKQVHTCTYTYNDKNDIAKKTCTCQEVYQFDESTVCPPENVSYSYSYDAHGNWTERNDGRKRKIEY